MKAFLAYRASGEDEESLLAMLDKVLKVLNGCGVEAYCTHLGGEPPRTEGKMIRAFQKIDDSQILIVLQNSVEKSEGMLLEIGYAYAKGMPIVMLNRVDLTPIAKELATNIIVWTDIGNLTKQLEVNTWQ